MSDSNSNHGPDDVRPIGDDFIEIDRGDTVWRFEREFLTSTWTCLFGKGCKGILRDDATELNQGCCSLGAHFGDGPAGQDEAKLVGAYASMLTPENFQFFDAAHTFDASDQTGADTNEADMNGGTNGETTPDRPAPGALNIYGDEERTHTRVVDGACIFLNRPGFAGGEGCALHVAALDADESPTEWKPSVCWQLPLRIDWETTPTNADPLAETATVRRWTRADWGKHGETMAWCCTERSEGAEAYSGTEQVVDSMRDELTALAGDEVYIELTRKLRRPNPRT